MDATEFIIVCPDLYEYIYPKMLNQDADDLLQTFLNGTGLQETMQALTVLTTSRETAEENDGPIPEPVSNILGRWFNHRIAILTKGKLYTKLRNQAEGELLMAKLRSEETAKVESDNYLVDSILDDIMGQSIMDEPDEEDPLAEAEATAEDKEEFVPKEQEYGNISADVAAYIQSASEIIKRSHGEPLLTMKVTPIPGADVEKLKAIKIIRSATGLGLTEAKAVAEGAAAQIKTGVYRDQKVELALRENGYAVTVS